jgi:hypothetical protein
MVDEQAGKSDPDDGFYRARRALGHLWHIHRGLTDYNPNGCHGCKEIHHFLTDPTYRGDTHYPAWDRLADRDWALGPDGREKVSEGERQLYTSISPLEDGYR